MKVVNPTNFFKTHSQIMEAKDYIDNLKAQEARDGKLELLESEIS